jgi:DinB superfamily
MNEPNRRFEGQWRFARGLTRDLLLSLEEIDLSFSPGEGIGPLWKQFRHVGRVQENYQRALATGRIEFSFEGTSYGGGASRKNLLTYLDRLDAELNESLRALGSDPRLIEWPGENVDWFEHLSRMVHHEILHHGMFIFCAKVQGQPMPKSWQAWGIE